MNRAGASNCCFASTMKPLCSHSVRFVYDCTVAWDLVSEVFYQLWRTSAYQRVRGPFLSYLFAAVSNEAYTYVRWEFKKGELTDTGAATLLSL